MGCDEVGRGGRPLIGRCLVSVQAPQTTLLVNRSLPLTGNIKCRAASLA